MQGTFGYELDLSKMTEDEKILAKEQVETFKKHYKLFQFGDYYRIESPIENRDFTAWEYADKNGTEASISVIFTDMHGNHLPHFVKFKGLLSDRKYNVCRDGEFVGVHTGAALMNGGILLPVPKENYDSCWFYICLEE